ncbi:MAG: TPM domain-containing protein [Verrucomicrobiales bacterium]|nr:TPM domain-containing protein [Verrucomicrobiales bacterium]
MEILKRNSLSMFCCAALSALACWFVFSASAEELSLNPPGGREFVKDHAGLLDKVSRFTVRSIGGALLRDQTIPIMIVTIESMDKYSDEDMRIEAFAGLLFDQWRIGQVDQGEESWNKGILLLVSKNDRKARIELGKGWGFREAYVCQKIMRRYIIPRFKRGDFAGGILAGVKALDKMARRQGLPSGMGRYSSDDVLSNLGGEFKSLAFYHLTMPMGHRPKWHFALFFLLAFTVVSLIRKGSSGWAWVFWAMVFGLLGTILMLFLKSGRRSGGFLGGGGFNGFGFGGGSFGGGSSGGGGATGSW